MYFLTPGALAARSAVMACALLLGSASAFADSTGEGAITGVSFTLIDLDPNDGVTPSVSFMTASDSAYAGAHAYGYVRSSTNNEDVYREYTGYGATPLSAITAGNSTDWSSASGSVAGAAGVGFSSMSVKGHAISGTDDHNDFYRGVYYSMVNVAPANFTLSANTAIVFSVAGWVRGETTVGGNTQTGFTESGGAVLLLEARGPDANGDLVFDRQSQAAVAWYNVADDGTVSGDSQFWRGTLSAGYSNYSSDSVTGQFAAQLSATGQSVAAVVPEPGTVALMVAGLAGLGAVVRRRQAKAHHSNTERSGEPT